MVIVAPHHTHTLRVGLLWMRDRLFLRPLHENTQHTQETHIPDAGGIRTRNRSKCTVEDLRLKPRGHRARAIVTCTFKNNTAIGNNFMARCSMAGPWFRRNSGGKQRDCSGENSKQATAVLSNIGRRLTPEGTCCWAYCRQKTCPSANYSLPVFDPTITKYIGRNALELTEATATISFP